MKKIRGTSLTIRGARGGSLVLMGSGGSVVIQAASLLILSRLLMPSDFGLIAMVSVFVTLGNLLRDFGLPLAGLQEQRLTHQQASNLFWMSVVVSAFSALLLWVSAPALVALFQEPRLTFVVPCLAIAMFLGGVTSQLQVQLARDMKFGALVASDILSQLIGLVVAVLVVIAGRGYWGLVAQSLTAASVLLAYRWAASRWIPLPPRKGQDAFRLFKIGATYGVAQLLAFAQSNIGSFLIGIQLGANNLGYYNRAYQLLTAPAARFLDPLTQVVISMMNRAKDGGRDPDALLYKVQFAVGTLIVWVFAVTAGTADGLIPLVLGSQWGPAVSLFQILAIGGCVLVFNHVSYWAFIVKEKPKQLLHYNLVSKPLEIASIFIGSLFGLEGVAWGYDVALVFSWPLFLGWLGATASFPARRFFMSSCRIILAGAAACTASAASFLALEVDSVLLGVVAGTVVGSIVYLSALLAMRDSRRLLVYWFGTLNSALRRHRLNI